MTTVAILGIIEQGLMVSETINDNNGRSIWYRGGRFSLAGHYSWQRELQKDHNRKPPPLFPESLLWGNGAIGNHKT
jgi:hypothetical protein